MADIEVYDKAKYHYEGQFPADLDLQQAFVHVGIYFGWACSRGMLSEMVIEDFEPELRRFRDRVLTAPHLFRLLGGTLASDMLSVQGNAFTAQYYSQRYLDDYGDVLGARLPTFYHVSDTWGNFDLMSLRLNQRLTEWATK